MTTKPQINAPARERLETLRNKWLSDQEAYPTETDFRAKAAAAAVRCCAGELHNILREAETPETSPSQQEALSDEQLARFFHGTYETLAPSFGYTTNEATREFDPESANGRLMMAVCAHVRHLLMPQPSPSQREAADVGAMADILGDWLRNTTGRSLTHVTLVDIVRVMLAAATKPGADDD